MSRRMSGALGGALVTTLVLSGAVVLGQEAAPASPAAEEEPGPYQATLRSGTCDEPGDVAAVLADPMLGASTDSEEVSVDMGPAPEHAVRVSESEVVEVHDWFLKVSRRSATCGTRPEIRRRMDL